LIGYLKDSEMSSYQELKHMLVGNLLEAESMFRHV
jgi:hypothetical protein